MRDHDSLARTVGSGNPILPASASGVRSSRQLLVSRVLVTRRISKISLAFFMALAIAVQRTSDIFS